MKRQRSKTKMASQGSILLVALLILAALLSAGVYFLSFTISGSKIAESQAMSTKAYYLAEAGVQEAIFKLKNDPVWKGSFETMPTVGDPTCSYWSISPFTRKSALFDGASYSITVENLGCAKAEITSLAEIEISPARTAQRIVKTKVFKAMGNPISEFNMFTGGSSENISIKFTDPLNVHNGSIFSNHNIKIEFWSNVTISNKALAQDKIEVSSWPFSSQLNATSCASNICDTGCEPTKECPPESVSMPPLDFDSDSPGSYLSRAKNSDCSSIRVDGKTNCVFIPKEFEQLMWQRYPELSLPAATVTYVLGDVNIRAGQLLAVFGVLTADRDVNVGEDLCWTSKEPPYLRCGQSQLTVVRPGSPEERKPAGLLSKRKMNIGNGLGFGTAGMNVEGLVYAGDELRLAGVAGPIEIHGGVAARKITTSSMWQGIDIYLEPDVIVDTFGNPTYSPVITIDHWEEEY